MTPDRPDLEQLILRRVLVECRFALLQIMHGSNPAQGDYVLEQIEAALNMASLDEAGLRALAVQIHALHLEPVDPEPSPTPPPPELSHPTMQEWVDQAAKAYKLGATGKPNPKPLNPSDRGELKAMLTVAGGELVLVFGEAVEWLAMTPDEAIALGQVLLNQALAQKQQSAQKN